MVPPAGRYDVRGQAEGLAGEVAEGGTVMDVCVWCSDIARHEANLRQFDEAGMAVDHPLVDRARRRLLWARRFDERRHPDSTGSIR